MKFSFCRKKQYEDYNNCNIGSLFKVKINDNLVPQGICYVSPYTFISCYTTNNEKSKVLIFNGKGDLFRTVDLDNKSHVGAISYDKKHNLLFICDVNGYVASYKYNEFVKGNIKSKKLYMVAKDTVGGGNLIEDGKVVCSYLTCFNAKLYVGSFNKKSKGLVKVFDIIRDNGYIKLKYANEFIVPKKIQGLTFYENKDDVYIFFSQSYTRVKNSKLLVSKYNFNESDYSRLNKGLILPPMLEQITLNNKFNILLLFESFAKKYNYNAKVVIDDIVIIDTEKVINYTKT